MKRPLSRLGAGPHRRLNRRPPSSRLYQGLNYRRLSILNTFADMRYLYKQTLEPREYFYKSLISTFAHILQRDMTGKETQHLIVIQLFILPCNMRFPNFLSAIKYFCAEHKKQLATDMERSMKQQTQQRTEDLLWSSP